MLSTVGDAEAVVLLERDIQPAQLEGRREIFMHSRVLLVDDNITVIRILTKFIEEEEYKVYSTTDSTSVVKMVRDISPDVILLDVVMPVLDGFEICRILKNDKDTSDIPIIILTGETDSRDIKKAVELGAIDYIRKPVEKVEVIARIQSACSIKRYQDKLRDLASKDGLTGLYNHAHLLERFYSVYNLQIQTGGNISFAMADIDFFKKINDTYGHIAGDTVLKELSAIFTWGIMENGIIGRYGGEEFGFIIADKTESEVFELFEALRKDIEEYRFLLGEQTINITVSIGYCFCRASSEISAESVLKSADEALYKAKKSGRNRVEAGAALI